MAALAPHSSAGEPILVDPLIGRIFAGKYRIEHLLGSGAMGKVYAAHHQSLEKSFAIKLLREDIAHNPIVVQRFKAEARAASQLEHPNSIRVFDFGEEDGCLYLVMELLRGQSLNDLLKRTGKIAPLRACRITSQVLSALAVAHQHNIVHRDLKPANIMLVRGQDLERSGDDFVKVCDFGIAKIQDSDQPDDPTAFLTMTKHGALVGTPAFMAPEQVRGDKVDGRADLFACGAVLYRMLSGENPFRAESMIGLFNKILSEEPAPLSRSLSTIDPRLDVLVSRALAKRPADRFQSAKEMHAALTEIISTPLNEYSQNGTRTFDVPQTTSKETSANNLSRQEPGRHEASRHETTGSRGAVSALGSAAVDSRYGQNTSQFGNSRLQQRASQHSQSIDTSTTQTTKHSAFLRIGIALLVAAGLFFFFMPRNHHAQLAELVADASYGAAENYALSHFDYFRTDTTAHPLLIETLAQRRANESTARDYSFDASYQLSPSTWAGTLKAANTDRGLSFVLRIEQVEPTTWQGTMDWPEHGVRVALHGFWHGNHLVFWENAILPGSDPVHAKEYRLREKKNVLIKSSSLHGIDGSFRNQIDAELLR